MCCVPHFHLLRVQLRFTKWARTATYPTLSAAVKIEKIIILQDGVYKSLGNSDCYVTWCINDVSATHAIILFGIKRVLISFVKKVVAKFLDTE